MLCVVPCRATTADFTQVSGSRTLSCAVRCCRLTPHAVCVCCTLQHYNYEFFAPQPDSEPMMIAASPNRPVDPVTAVVMVPNNQ
jgi:hypothetical protein